VGTRPNARIIQKESRRKSGGGTVEARPSQRKSFCSNTRILSSAQSVRRRHSSLAIVSESVEIESRRSNQRARVHPQGATGIISIGGPGVNPVPRMKRLFSGTVQVHYSAMYFQGAASGMPEGGQYFEGQVNGLCGAGGRSYLLLMTGLHTGGVKVTIDFWDGEPPLDDSWE